MSAIEQLSLLRGLEIFIAPKLTVANSHNRPVAAVHEWQLYGIQFIELKFDKRDLADSVA